MKRLAIYAFWEKEGIVRSFVIYYLRELYKIADDVLVVVNGNLSAEGRVCLENIGVKVIARENKEFFPSFIASIADFDSVRGLNLMNIQIC